MKMATYREIRDDVKARHNRTVKPCWIAHVKELNGLPLKVTRRRRSPDGSRGVTCPAYARPWIEESMWRLGVLPALPLTTVVSTVTTASLV
jgi:hypothetical protein